MKNKKLVVGITALIILIAFIVGVNLYKKNQASQAANITLVPDDAPKLGPANPKIYLVEFLDPECETCRDFYPIVKMLMNEFDGQIQLVIRYAPFHPNSRMAIKLLEAARKQGKYWEALEVLFRYQPLWGSHHHPQPQLMWKYLPESGVDMAKIAVDMNDPAIDSYIEREMRDVQTLGVRKTPSFFVNGKPLETFGVEPLRELIRSSL